MLAVTIQVIFDTQEKLIKHDRYLKALTRRLRPNYDEIHTNIQLYSKRKGRKIAEVDLLAIRDNTCDVFEVKCSYRPVKAKKQLKRIRRLMPEVKRTFFFCGESDVMENII